MAVQMPPILKDSTGQSINTTLSGIDTTLGNANTNLAGIITALQALSAPSATNVAVSPTGLHYITEDDAQGALAELDAECFALNNSLTQLELFTGQLVNHNTTNYLIGTVLFEGGANPDCTLKIQIGKLDNSNNYIQFFINDVDYGYVKFDTSRNIGIIA